MEPANHSSDHRNGRRRGRRSGEWRHHHGYRYRSRNDLHRKNERRGIFNLARVPIGNYQVKAEAAGFQSSIQNGLTLVLNQTARLDFKLTVGAVTTTTQVTAEAPVLQSETTQVSTLIDSKTVTDIPLATRNYVQLTLLAPGSVHPDASAFNNGDNVAKRRTAVHQRKPRAVEQLHPRRDGQQPDVGQPAGVYAVSGCHPGVQPHYRTTRPADFGNFMGGIVNASIKSGTNHFHGDVWEFFRNDVLECQSVGEQAEPERRTGETDSTLEHVRRHTRRSDLQRQAVLLCGLSRTALRSPGEQQLHHCLHECPARR